MAHGVQTPEDRIVQDDDGTLWQRRPGGLGTSLAVAAIGLAALAVGQLTWVRGNVQPDLRGRSLAALEQAGYDGLQVSVSGRDVEVTGTADPAQVPAIRSLVESQTGVRVVKVVLAGNLAGAGTGRSTATATGTASATATPTATASPTTTPTPTASATASATATGTPTSGSGSSGTALSGEIATAEASIGALPKIEFPTAMSGPTAQGRQVIARIAGILAQHPEVKVLIEGHTDDLGTARVNLQLSASRAEVVRILLIRAGVSGSRLTARGFGETKPLVPNTSAVNRASNRRVAFTLS
jgi:outer membrane protein OmpA-like peptidoglycan-associated protein